MSIKLFIFVVKPHMITERLQTLLCALLETTIISMSDRNDQETTFLCDKNVSFNQALFVEKIVSICAWLSPTVLFDTTSEGRQNRKAPNCKHSVLIQRKDEVV